MVIKTAGTALRKRAIVQVSIGVLLVAGSVVGVLAILDERDSTLSVAVATTDTPMGTSGADVSVSFVDVPGSLTSLPVLSQAEFTELSSLVSNRVLRAGDIVSSRDFSVPENLDATALSLELSIGEPHWLVPGQRVVLWVAPPASENSFSAPFVLSSNVVIHSLSKDEGFAANGILRQVNVLISHRDVPGAIHALSNRYFLYLVPVISTE